MRDLHKKRSSVILVLLLMVILVFSIPTSSFAASTTITIPTFKVTLNGEVVDNTYSQYPLIAYKNITYFPMTYHDAGFLGLTTKWDQVTGLEIQQAGSSITNYQPYKTSAKNRSSYTATLPTFNVKVNGKSIDNKKEEYPLLTFRGITYFPLTWRFAVDEFGWEYKFSSQTGLVITSNNNSFNNPTPSPGVTYPIILEKESVFNGNTYTIRVKRHKDPSFGNLSISSDGKSFNSIGNAQLFYGAIGSVEQNSIGFTSNDYLEVKDGWIHLFASDAFAKESGLYKVNLLTGETLKVKTE